MKCIILLLGTLIRNETQEFRYCHTDAARYLNTNF